MRIRSDRPASKAFPDRPEAPPEESENQSGSSSTDASEWLSHLATWDLCVLLTYDLDRPTTHTLATRVGLEGRCRASVGDDVRRWLLRCEELLGSPIRAIFRQEHHQRGWPHWHGVVAAPGILTHQIAAMEEEWFDEHGYAWIERPLTPAGLPSRGDPRTARVSASPLTVAEYCTKYLCGCHGSLVIHGLDQKIPEIVRRLAPRNLVTMHGDAGRDLVPMPDEDSPTRDGRHPHRDPCAGSRRISEPVRQAAGPGGALPGVPARASHAEEPRIALSGDSVIHPDRNDRRARSDGEIVVRQTADLSP